MSCWKAEASIHFRFFPVPSNEEMSKVEAAQAEDPWYFRFYVAYAKRMGGS